MQLKLRQEACGPRHYLAGKPVHCGDIIATNIKGIRRQG
jgi:hypothetical protein